MPTKPKPKFKGVRFYNRNTIPVSFSTPRGARISLAPGEFATDPYYRRFARYSHEPLSRGKPLTIEGDELPDPVLVSEIAAPSVAPKEHVAMDSPPGGCAMSCEVACQFPAEVEPDTLSVINRQMDIESTGQPSNEGTPADTLPASVHTPEEPEIPGDTIRLTPAELPEIKARHNFQDDQLIEVNDEWVKVMVGDPPKETYFSRFLLSFHCHKQPEIRKHIKEVREQQRAMK